MKTPNAIRSRRASSGTGTWQIRWAAGITDGREGDLADTADDREDDECD